MQTNTFDQQRSMRGGRRLLGLAVTLLLSAAPALAQETLRIPYFSDIGSFDPDNAFEVGALSAINNVYEGLVEYKPGTTEIVGLLAKSWDISPDGLTYTFHLVTGATFHDGTPFNAEAVITAFTRRRDNELVLSYFLANVKDMQAPDAETLVLTLGQPQPSLLDAFSSPWGPKVVSPTALAEHAGDDVAKTWLNENAVGTGPFKLTEFKRGEEYTLTRNDDYWGAEPYFSEIQIPVIADVGQQILQLQAAEIDAVPNNYPWAQLGGLPAGVEVTAMPSMALVEAFVKPGSPLDDAEVRQAVLTAINPALWVKDAFGAYATPARSLYQLTMLDPKAPVAFPTDMEAAKAAIAAAGPIRLVLGYSSEETTNVGRVADLMVAQLALIGIQATINVLPSGAAYAMKGDAGAPDLYISRSSPDAAHPENQATVFYTAGAPLNFFGVELPEADALVKQAGTKTDVPERNALYERAGQLYFDAGFFIPLVDVQDVVVSAEGLADLGLRPVFPPGNIDFATVRWAD
ncbi:ABC transporter substrate-binding protein [uncultured Devosia sp.]|uniref:ABC transporter substrate-binding protein n=1 Tax=uncultured Devosia sp. TaxID=211434 RepID=UPI0035CB9FBF